MKSIPAIPLLFFVAFIECAHADTFGSGANTFDIEFVAIGNPGNPTDTTGDPNPAGSVPHRYRMGKFEISEQMVAKASAEGGLGIINFPSSPHKPATGVSWNEAARFVNWLNMSSGFPPAYKFAIQPGEVGYDRNSNIELWTVSDPGYNPNNLFRNSLAKYILPSTHEWYKAAYYDPIKGIYYNYPTGSDSIPDGIDIAGDPNFDAVFHDPGGNIDEPNDITNVGLLSPYGTGGQGGNVTEWMESAEDQTNDSGSAFRELRGGQWALRHFLLSSSLSGNGVGPTAHVPTNGFRVASIPEPSTLLLCICGLAMLRLRRRHLLCLRQMALVATDVQEAHFFPARMTRELRARDGSGRIRKK